MLQQTRYAANPQRQDLLQEPEALATLRALHGRASSTLQKAESVVNGALLQHENRGGREHVLVGAESAESTP